jgi:hypothetical protein
MRGELLAEDFKLGSCHRERDKDQNFDGDVSRPVNCVIRTSAVVGAKQRGTQQQLQRRMGLSITVASRLHKSEAINHLREGIGYPTHVRLQAAHALQAG